MSSWSQHVENWRDCTRCPLHLTRKNVVLARGKLPCEVLFLGEAPGTSEDVLGSPFVGPAGQLLDKIIAKALADALLVKPAESIRIAFTNVVACMPPKVGSDHRPSQVAIYACHPRLVEFVSQCAKPKVVVLVGDVARKEIVGQADFGDCEWLGRDEFIRFAEVKHPAAILRTDVSTRALECQFQAAKIAEVLEELK